MSDFVRVPVGGGSPEGSNSAYVLPDHSVLIDPGPPGDEAYERLRTGLADAGISVSDIDHVVVTHWHADHVGLAPRLAAAAGATIHMHKHDAPLLGSYREERRKRTRRDAATLAEWGVPEVRVEEVRAGDTPSPLPDETPVVAHEDGDVVAGGEILHTPGHTLGHLAIRFGDAMFVGDTVLPTYTPNVGGSDTRSTTPLTDYLQSLRRLLEHDGEFFPGHGGSLAIPERVETIRTHHRERTERVLARLEARGDATPWDVAVDLFGEMHGIHVKFGAGEAAAHLRALADASFAERIETDPDRYAVRDVPSTATLAEQFE
ncbi:MBL fold metallo-hydrolase [Halogeometricum limi]|uniref:Glyoxylase, beta-lactamase superfamily II n=1 Tax=Halogeometricum limi TaxID=555875 RepID=A0A1I6IB78_9EURY|nr:MBL fold metallo-hydrolase [Halogeometricum limi]SFR63884.1 Glyoxylase, beta-lactamase superfamily II [Halogeometricum limi]